MERIKSVDIVRIIAVIAVIVLHSSPFRADLPRDDEIYKYIEVIANQMARFAVPFFFVISGFFWGEKVRNCGKPVASANNMGRKIIFVFLAWCLIYLLPYNLSSIYDLGAIGPLKLSYWKIKSLTQEPAIFFFQGTKAHLWFLVSLLISVYLSAIFLKMEFLKGLFTVSLLLYVFGLLARSYVDTPIGFETNMNTRHGPFFSLLPFVSGYYLSGCNLSLKWFRYGVMLSLFGLIVQFAETYYLWKHYATSTNQDYVVGTYFMGVGVAMISLSNHRFLQNKFLAFLGRMTLGIYAIHYIFIDMFSRIDERVDYPLWEFGYVFIVFGLSVISVILLSKNRITKKIVI